MANRKALIAVGAAIVIFGSLVSFNSQKIYVGFLEGLNEYGMLPSWQAPYLYKHYLQELNATTNDVYTVSIQEDIESISPLIIRQLSETYRDSNASRKSRSAAAFGLIKADKAFAESVFIEFLDSEDERLVSDAIWDLARAESAKPFDSIADFVEHPNQDIRFACAVYLGNFETDESIGLLRDIMANDPTEYVKTEAKLQLESLGALPEE